MRALLATVLGVLMATAATDAQEKKDPPKTGGDLKAPYTAYLTLETAEKVKGGGKEKKTYTVAAGMVNGRWQVRGRGAPATIYPGDKLVEADGTVWLVSKAQYTQSSGSWLCTAEKQPEAKKD